MKVNGRVIAQKLLAKLKKKIDKLKLHPTLAVILVGENPASISFIKQKEKATGFIGTKLILKKFPQKTPPQKLIKTIGELNKNQKVNGIILQLPLPETLKPEPLLRKIYPEKDVDGFHPQSPFTPPVAGAVLKILGEVKHLGRWQA